MNDMAGHAFLQLITIESLKINSWDWTLQVSQLYSALSDFIASAQLDFIFIDGGFFIKSIAISSIIKRPSTNESGGLSSLSGTCSFSDIRNDFVNNSLHEFPQAAKSNPCAS